MEIAILGIDLGKNSCSLVGLDLAGQVSVRRRMRRETVVAFCQAAHLHHRDGGLLRRPSHGAHPCGSWSHCPIDVT